MLRRSFLVLATLLLAQPAAASEDLAVRPAGITLEDRTIHLEVDIAASQTGRRRVIMVFVDDKLVHEQALAGGTHKLAIDGVPISTGTHEVLVRSGSSYASTSLRVIPAWLSIVPPLVAIVLALWFKDVLVALFAGIFSGALVLAAWNPATAFARVIDKYVVDAVADPDHAAILVFSTLLGGMVALITKNGGTRGVVERISRWADDARHGQFATWVMGIVVFFDDYANTLVVGPTMRPITDRLKISREKLAYIVDSTAAPVASLVPISTWIGYEVGLIGAAFTSLGLDVNPYTAFLASIPYRFYPIFALVLVLAIAVSGRDAGPMLRAERRARLEGKPLADDAAPLANFDSTTLTPPEEVKPRSRNALIPIGVVIGVTLLGLWITGSGSAPAEGSTFVRVRTVLENANSYQALMWASLAAVVTALLLSLRHRSLPLGATIGAMVEGFKSMLLALVVLVLAWGLGAICTDLSTADFVVSAVQGAVSPAWVPVLVFVAAAGISFATGTSWATMAILMPLAIPTIHKLALAAGHAPGSDPWNNLILGTISSVLAGAVWGDHCSPISDTTVLSSMASGCDHIDHVRTQAPYALGIGVLGMLVGDIPTAYGLPTWVSLVIGVAAILLAVRFLFRRPEDEAPNAVAAAES